MSSPPASRIQINRQAIDSFPLEDCNPTPTDFYPSRSQQEILAMLI
jgi:hypothetical protein